MDVRAKQRLCYLACPFPRCCVVAVSPHVNSAVRRLLLIREVQIMKTLKTYFLFVIALVSLQISVSAQDNCIAYDDNGECERRCTSYNSNGSCDTVEVILRRSRSSSSSKSNNSSNPVNNSNEENLSDEEKRARERNRAYEAQKNGQNNTATKPQTIVVTRKPGESDEDFRARQRTAAYEAQKKEQKQEEQLPAVDEWTKEDAKKYPGADKVRWERATCQVSAGGVTKCPQAALNFTAAITDKTGWVALQGAYMQISNPNSKYPLYFGIGWGLRDKLEPGETRIVELPPQYVPTNPSERLALSPRVATIEVRYVVP